jgi:hypothetical protein
MTRANVIVLDRSGYDLFRYADGTPFLDPEQYRVTLVTPPDKLGQVRPGEVDTVLPTNVLDEKAVLGLVPTLAQGAPIHHVVAVSERLLLAAGHYRDALGVPGFSAQQMSILRNKATMKRHIGAAGVRVPEFLEIERPMDAADLLARHDSVILKPVASMGSVGVHHVRTIRELRALDAGGLSHDGRYEAEEFIDGDMYHIDSVVRAGRPVVALPSLYLDSNQDFPVGGQNRSVVIDQGPTWEMLLEFNRHVLSTVPWFSGVTHHEVFVDREGKPVFCEIAGRPGGGGIVPAFAHRFGIDLTLTALLPQLGRPLPALREIQPAERRATGTAVYYPPALGTLRAFEDFQAKDWVVKFTPLKKVGAVLTRAVSVGQGVAEVTVCGSNADTIRRRLDAVKAQLRLTITPVHELADTAVA